jgi:zinc finger protein
VNDGRHFPFTFIIEDPSGNSFLQNPNAPSRDEYTKIEHFPRSAEDYVTMGYNPDLADSQAKEDEDKHKVFLKE